MKSGETISTSVKAAAWFLGADLDDEAARPSEEGFSTCSRIVAIVRGGEDAGRGGEDEARGLKGLGRESKQPVSVASAIRIQRIWKSKKLKGAELVSTGTIWANSQTFIKLTFLKLNFTLINSLSIWRFFGYDLHNVAGMKLNPLLIRHISISYQPM